jgi:hypothetical protein
LDFLSTIRAIWPGHLSRGALPLSSDAGMHRAHEWLKTLRPNPPKPGDGVEFSGDKPVDEEAQGRAITRKSHGAPEGARKAKGQLGTAPNSKAATHGSPSLLLAPSATLGSPWLLWAPSATLGSQCYSWLPVLFLAPSAALGSQCYSWLPLGSPWLLLASPGYSWLPLATPGSPWLLLKLPVAALAHPCS